MPKPFFKQLLNKLNLQALLKDGISAHFLVMLVALFLTLTANVTFFKQVTNAYPIGSHFLFLLSLFLVVFGVMVLLFALISNRFILKGVLIVLLVVSSITGYFTDSYGTVYDTNMLQNALQTDQKESADLFNVVFLLRIIVLGLLPSLLIFKIKVNYPKGIKKIILNKVLLIITSLALILLPIVANSKVYASFFRVHKPLRYYTNPITPIYSVVKLSQNEYKKFSAPKELIMHASDAKKIEGERKPRLMIFVVGETARADRVNFNGYERITFPQLTKLKESDDKFYNYPNVMACGTSTAYSVPCMFSYLGANHYDVDTAVYQENALDTLNRLGVDVLWRDNNSDDKGVMTRMQERYQNYRGANFNNVCNETYGECRDVGMLIGLDAYINERPNKDIVIVLHQMGNHGPAYYKRYDEKFNQFTPVCQDNELAKCEIGSLYNAYDNALLATDDFLYQSIELLKQYQDKYDVAMLYVSDHGESLGEKGVYLHGMPNAFAPIEQKHIPAFLWLGANVPFASVDEKTELSHDAISPTLLKFFDIESKVLDNKTAFLK